jgi:sensor domain CHASE-containing protein
MKREKIINKKAMRLWTGLVFVATFILILICSYLLNLNQKKDEELKAVYTADTTVNRLEAQLNKYLSESNLMKHIIENGYDIDIADFSTLSSLIEDDRHIIEAYELAKNGIISQIYPFEGNEEALGLNMLENADRKKEANLAKDSGEYTIAGPFELIQGGTGALLFDPIYLTDNNGNENFWGFSILVINWDNFISQIDLDKL